MLDANSILHAITALVVALIGIYLERTHRAKERFTDGIEKRFESLDTELNERFEGIVKDVKDLDVRAQLAEVQRATLDTKSEAQASAIAKFHEDLSDIRENMVRRSDLDALVGQITSARRGRPRV